MKFYQMLFTLTLTVTVMHSNAWTEGLANDAQLGSRQIAQTSHDPCDSSDDFCQTNCTNGSTFAKCGCCTPLFDVLIEKIRKFQCTSITPICVADIDDEWDDCSSDGSCSDNIASDSDCGGRVTEPARKITFSKLGPCWYTAPTEPLLLGIFPLKKIGPNCDHFGCNNGCSHCTDGDFSGESTVSENEAHTSSPPAPKEIPLTEAASVIRRIQRAPKKLVKFKHFKAKKIKTTAVTRATFDRLSSIKPIKTESKRDVIVSAQLHDKTNGLSEPQRLSNFKVEKAISVMFSPANPRSITVPTRSNDHQSPGEASLRFAD